MKIVPISEISDNLIFKDIYGIFQRWQKKDKFSYLETPRPNHGFMYINCDYLVITDGYGKSTKYHKGTILYLPEGHRYSASFHDSKVPNTFLINFNMNLVSGEPVWFSDTILPLVTVASSEYTDAFHTIIEAFRSTENSHLIIKSAFYNLCAKLTSHQQKHTFAASKYNDVSPALLYMQNHISEPASVPELSKLCALSESSFRRIFKKCTGMSPVAYSRFLKIKKAKELLEHTDATLTNISDTLGFYDLSYFRKVFEQETDCSPSDYRKKTLS